jgi:hypothetical protein
VRLQVRYFLSYDQLNIRMREASLMGSALRATWLSPSIEPLLDDEEIATVSKQAARAANKIDALDMVQASCVVHVSAAVMTAVA